MTQHFILFTFAPTTVKKCVNIGLNILVVCEQLTCVEELQLLPLLQDQLLDGHRPLHGRVYVHLLLRLVRLLNTTDNK